MRSAQLIFAAALSELVYIYAGYTCCLWVLGRFRRFRSYSHSKFEPSVSVLISARNEERDIRWKIEETLSWNYPPDRLELLVASDASEDHTDEILRGFSDQRLKFIRTSCRVGKNEALNQLFALARGEVLFFTDANSHIGPDCLGNMVRHFSDPRVGCVTGWERTLSEASGPAMAAGGSAYLGHESLTNHLESEIGSVLVCDGSIFCIRRNLFQTLQPDLANDLQLPLMIGAAGHAILYEPGAFSSERATGTPQEEFHRKRRICAQGILAFWRLRRNLHGARAWQFYSRKVLRWLAAIPLFLLLVTSATLSRNPVFAAAFAAQLLFYGLALLGWQRAVSGRKSIGWMTMPLYFVLVNLAALTGIVQSCLGSRFSVWDIPVLSRGSVGGR